MTQRVAMIRHGPTTWNKLGRIQGWSDVGLSQKGREAVSSWHLPNELYSARWVSSPLLRAVQTAYQLGAVGLLVEPRLMEMKWGGWEGKTLKNIRSQDPVGSAATEGRGLDFQPPGGESPRLLQERVAAWLAEIARQDGLIIAVTHKGVIRTTVARAYAWDMIGPSPIKLDWSSAHIFRLKRDGTPVPDRFNLSLCSSA